MTISAAIAAVAELKPHAYDAERLIAWLHELDTILYAKFREESVIDWLPEAWEGYEENISRETELLAPAPYDIPLYTHWLCMKISLYNRELTHYNSEAILFAEARDALARHITRAYPSAQGSTHFRL